MKNYFDAIPICNSRYASNNTNMISRIQNSVASALNKSKRIPAYVVVVLDYDLPDGLNVKSLNLCELIGPWLEWLISQFNSMFQDRKDKLPKKSVRMDDPFFYWVLCPLHTGMDSVMYDTRKLFKMCLKSIIKLQPNMCTIQLKSW